MWHRKVIGSSDFWVHKGLFKQIHVRPLLYHLWLLGCYISRTEQLQQRIDGAQSLKDELRRKHADFGLRKELLDRGPTHAKSQYKNSGNGRETGNKMERWHQRGRDQILWILCICPLTIHFHVLQVTCFCLVSAPNICKFLKTRQCFLAINEHLPHPLAWSGSLWTFFLPPFQKLTAVVSQLKIRSESWLCYLLTVRPWTDCLTSLSCNFLTDKVGLLLHSLMISVKIQWDSTKKLLDKCCHKLLLRFFLSKNVTWQVWIPDPTPRDLIQWV